MKKAKLLDILAKEAFIQLRKQILYCPLFQQEIKVTRLFFNHIYFGSEKRSKQEIQNRLLLIPLIPKALEKGEIIEIRKKDEWIMTRLEAEVSHLKIGIILTKKQSSQEIELYSCFLSTRKRPISSSLGPSSSRLLGQFCGDCTPKNKNCQTKRPISPSDGTPHSGRSDLTRSRCTLSKNKSQDLLQIFQNFLIKENLQDQKLLLMVSGGVDSIVLLNVAAKAVDKKNLAVFHLNHNVRKEAEEDRLFVQNICSKLKIKFYNNTLPPCPQKTKGGKEAYWRELRQRLSQKAAKDFGAKRTLTAHHATDLVETIIFRLAKGCGISGLSPFDISTKPFWQIPKKDLIAYAQENNLKWKEDETNQNTNFERNRIRHNILPELRSITPNLEKVFIRQAKTFGEIQDFLDSFFQFPIKEKWESLHLQKELKSQKILLKKFYSLPPILQKEFLRKIAEKVPSQSEINDCLKWLLNSPKGNSQKSIGNTKLKIKKKNIIW